MCLLPHIEGVVCREKKLVFSVEEVNFVEFYARYFVTIRMLNYLFWSLILSFEACDLLYVPRVLTLRLLMSYIYIYIYIYGVPILDVCRSHTTTHHSRYDSSGRVISSSQRPLPDNTRHSQHTNIHAPGGIRTHDLNRQAACGHSPGFESHRGHGYLSVVSVVCCQVEVSATS